MSDFFEIVKKRLSNINVEEKNNQRNELREISQEILLSGLAKAGFFNNAVFMGGTALRLVHGLNRYSEDLDFRFIKDDKIFDWKNYYDFLNNYARQYGGNLKYGDDSYKNLNRAFFNNDMLIENIHNKKIFNLEWAKNKAGSFEIIEVKLEVSYQTAPFEMKNQKLSFPEEHIIKIFDIHSLCAGKIKAILTRRDKIGNEVNEGRDWFDLNWFVKKGVEPNFKYLFASLEEDKKYKGKSESFNENFIKNELFNRARGLNYQAMNLTIESITTKDNRLVLNHDVVKDIINNLGKDGYIIKNKRMLT